MSGRFLALALFTIVLFTLLAACDQQCQDVCAAPACGPGYAIRASDQQCGCPYCAKVGSACAGTANDCTTLSCAQGFHTLGFADGCCGCQPDTCSGIACTTDLSTCPISGRPAFLENACCAECGDSLGRVDCNVLKCSPGFSPVEEDGGSRCIACAQN